jgi:hypothetical protein
MTPIESVYVEISDLELDTYTDINGEFIFDDLYPVEYDLSFTHFDYVPQDIFDVVVISNDTTELDVVMDEYGAIGGTVSDTLGSPIDGVIVTDINTGYADTTQANGEYLLTRLVPGLHDISFLHTIYGTATIENVIVNSGQTTVLNVTLDGLPLCNYVVGDVNNSSSLNVLDPLYGMYYFMGGADPPYLCECTVGNEWTVACDANGNCVFNGLDLAAMYDYFRHYSSEVTPCPDCPPAEWPLSNSKFEEIIASIDFDYNSPVINLKDYTQPKSENILLTDDGVELWFGNVDGSPIDALPGQAVGINVYISMAPSTPVGCFNLPLGADDTYISGFLSESQGHVYGLTDWDIVEFVPVDGSPPNPAGWSSQSLMAVIEFGGPFLGDWLHYETPTLLGTFVLQTIDDSSLVNQTVQCIGPGISSRQGAAVFGDNTALIEHEVTQHFSPIHFLDPNAYAGALEGTVTDNAQNPIEGALVTVEGTANFDMTESDGTFLIENIVAGTYDIGFSHHFYQDTLLTGISIAVNDTATADMILYEGTEHEITLMYGTMSGAPLNAVIGSRLNIDVYMQTGTDVWIEYLNIALGLENQYFDSLLSENEGQYFDVLPQWDEVFFNAPAGSPPNPAGWSAESMVGFCHIVPPIDNPRLNCPTPTKIATFVVKIPNDSSLIGDTVMCEIRRHHGRLRIRIYRIFQPHSFCRSSVGHGRSHRYCYQRRPATGYGCNCNS